MDQPTDTTQERRDARPTATGVSDPHATRLVRVEMAVDDLAEDVRTLRHVLESRAAFWQAVIARLLDPPTLRWLVLLCLGVGVLLGGGSLALGEWVSLGQAAATP